ncbi:MAG: sensor histidine kinase, partial [Pseudomonadota bacterium]
PQACRDGGGRVVLAVTDTGPGIPGHMRGKVVERFERLDSARTQPGSGLGLALVDAVAELHNGVLDLLNGDGPPKRPGLKAVLRLPRAV